MGKWRLYAHVARGFDYLDSDMDNLETDALPKIAENGGMVGCRHKGFGTA